jgi:hypothetical protein
VVFNLWVQGGLLALSVLIPFGVSAFKLWESFSVGWLALTIVFALDGFAYVYAFIKMLQHYRLPYDAAFDLCVDDLRRIAVKWHTTYEMVNLLLFVLFYLILLGLNVFVGYYLLLL